jgi:Phosphotransferase enzyme family
METSEVRLAGGRLNEVVRVGDTVRRPSGPWTPSIHALLRHVRERGFLAAPEPLGIDEHGREVLRYLPGETLGASYPWPAWVWTDNLLADMGSLSAAYHAAVSDFDAAGLRWQYELLDPGTGGIVCHHDLAPYNVVASDGSICGVFDWDLAGPGTARSDLAFVAWQWVPLHHPASPVGPPAASDAERARRLVVLLDAYGLEDRRGFVAEVCERVRFNRDVMVERADAGSEAYRRLIAIGHVADMERTIAFLDASGDRLQAAIE